MQQLLDITGERRGKLTVIGFSHTEKIKNKVRSYWICECDCGNTKIMRKDAFYYSYSSVKSCGCWHREESSKRPKDRLGRFKTLKER